MVNLFSTFPYKNWCKGTDTYFVNIYKENSDWHWCVKRSWDRDTDCGIINNLLVLAAKAVAQISIVLIAPSQNRDQGQWTVKKKSGHTGFPKLTNNKPKATDMSYKLGSDNLLDTKRKMRRQSPWTLWVFTYFEKKAKKCTNGEGRGSWRQSTIGVVVTFRSAINTGSFCTVKKGQHFTV